MHPVALIQSGVNALAIFASDFLLPIMVLGFLGAIFLRCLIHFTLSREYWFGKEFEKRTNAFLENDPPLGQHSFYVVTKRLLEKTYYELFEVRGIMKRRKPDAVTPFIDRVFLIQHGCARLVRSILSHIRFLKYDGNNPKFLEVSKGVFENNPCFTRVFGILPTAVFNEFLNVLPGMFIIGGIFGTFLGIMKALPELGNMNLDDVEGTKALMDAFLLKVSFSMTTSVVGIFLSVLLTFINTFMSSEKMFVNTINRFESTLLSLWHFCSNNEVPKDMKAFDEHRDPMDALATEAVKKELDKKKRFMPQVA